MSKKRTTGRARRAPMTLDAAIARYEAAESALAQLRDDHKELVQQVVELARTKLTRAVLPAPARAMSDEEIVRKREQEVSERAALAAARLAEKRAEEDKAFIDNAVRELMAQGMGRLAATAEAKRLRATTKGIGLPTQPE